eukprot:TRINITY_DN13292_c0_g1_i1.p2 TRINITY_DN13292_c0_g1~~TRINITY_DN13292_c0_g1_i1.p2  ORF type:complete len:122 (+),score=1.44 TRINITY_DN13292_c0_g1_i1:492-857(+)
MILNCFLNRNTTKKYSIYTIPYSKIQKSGRIFIQTTDRKRNKACDNSFFLTIQNQQEEKNNCIWINSKSLTHYNQLLLQHYSNCGRSIQKILKNSQFVKEIFFFNFFSNKKDKYNTDFQAI